MICAMNLLTDVFCKHSGDLSCADAKQKVLLRFLGVEESAHVYVQKAPRLLM